MKFYTRLFATLTVLLLTVIFFKEIAVNTTLFLIISCGIAILYAGFRYSRYTRELEETFKIALFIPIVIFLLWFFYLLAKVTVFLFLITVISFCIIQDGLYKVTSQIFGDREFEYDDLSENVWYGIGMLAIIIPAFIAFDYDNYLNLSNTSVWDYAKTRISTSHFSLQDFGNTGNYLENSWVDLKNFAKNTTVSMMQGILKSSFIGIGIFNIADSAIKYFIYR